MPSRLVPCAALTLAACAAASTPATTPVAPTARPMLDRVASLVEHAATPSQLTAERVGEALEMKMTTAEPGHFGATAALTPRWSFDVEGHDGGLLLGFRASADGLDATEVCTPDAPAFVERLARAGFTHEVWYGEHGRRMGHLLAKDGWAIRISTRGESEARAGHACVAMIEIKA